ncbi:hypothetical protein ACSVDE_11675 [Pseudalkalibacillus sp. Hm43]
MEIWTILTIIVLVFAVRWIKFVKMNTDKQIEQNEEIIALLKELNGKKQN